MIAAILAYVYKVLGLTGTNGDAAGTTTIFARLRQIYDNMLKNAVWTDARAAKIDAIDTKATSIGTINDPINNPTTLFGVLLNIYHKVLGAGNIPGTVKSIQRGKLVTSDLISNIEVPISFIDSSKACVIISGALGGVSSASGFSGMFIHAALTAELANEKITLNPVFSGGLQSFSIKCAWQVIEYY